MICRSAGSLIHGDNYLIRSPTRASADALNLKTCCMMWGPRTLNAVDSNRCHECFCQNEIVSVGSGQMSMRIGILSDESGRVQEK